MCSLLLALPCQLWGRSVPCSGQADCDTDVDLDGEAPEDLGAIVSAYSLILLFSFYSAQDCAQYIWPVTLVRLHCCVFERTGPLRVCCSY